MSKLSQCIFEWDSDDYNSAKRSEMRLAGLMNTSDSAIRHAITKEELSRHCRWRTCGTKKTTDLVQALLLTNPNPNPNPNSTIPQIMAEAIVAGM